jgi:hypothetical protein
MTSKLNSFGLSGALSIAAASLTLAAPALGQDAAADTTAPADDSSSADSAGTDPLATEPPAPAEPTEGPVEPTPEVSEPPSQDPPAVQSSEAKTSEGDKAPAKGWGVVQLKVLELPWTAYPSQQVRGITYGSLWRTFHGQQWPYMPPDEKEPVALQVGFSGGIWSDVSNTQIQVDPSLAGASLNDQNRWVSQSRAVFRVTPTYNVGKGWFVQGNVELVGQGDMRPDVGTGVLATTDDLWIRVGKWNLFDITVGRFQGWEIANHFGMGLDWATLERQGAWIVSSSLPKPTDGYGLDYFWDRQNFLLGGYALHVYPTKWLRGELLTHIGAGNSSNAGNPYQIDVRPSVIVDVGWMKLKGGYEFGVATPQDSKQLNRDQKNGWGVAAQFVLAPYVEFGGSVAQGYQDIIDKDGLVELAASNTATSMGGFVNVSPGWEPLVIGGGLFLKQWENMRYNTEGGVDTNEQWLAFGAVQYNLWKQLYLKLVVSHASNKVENFKAGNYVNNAMSGRLRVEVLF